MTSNSRLATHRGVSTLEEDEAVQLSYVSWHTDNNLLTSDPRARSERESTGSGSEQQDQVIKGRAPPVPSVNPSLPPSVLHRLMNNANGSPPVASTQPCNTYVAVDDRVRDFAQVTQQAALTSSTSQQARRELVKIREKAAKDVQSTLIALRRWYAAERGSEPSSTFDIKSIWESLTDPTPKLPENSHLLKLVHHYHPSRGEVPIQVCDFGDGRADHFSTTLGNIEQCWKQKPDWATVRWIHAPLGVGITHSSVEDLFRHDAAEGWAFRNVAGPNWPYIAGEVFSLEHRDTYKASRDTCILTNKIRRFISELDRTTFQGDHNTELENDIRWRAGHLGTTMSFLDLASSDVGYQLPDGRGLGLNGPSGGIRPLDTKLDEQVLCRYPFFRLAQIVRSPFRCFHRGDGILLTLSSMRGVNYLDKELSNHLQEPSECLFGNPDASALGQIWKAFSSSGTKGWYKATVEWFLVYLMTEIICTPHSISQGHNAPTVQFAYQNIIQDFKRRRFEDWKRGDSVKLVRDYIMCVDEIALLVHLMSKQLDFLYRLKKDCHELDKEESPVNNPDGKKTETRVDWAISIVEEHHSVLETMLKDLRMSMIALFQLRSIEQNDLAIAADSQNKAILAFTGVTIIFLPLSFFATYFGMNLRGVINTKHDEHYFWRLCGSLAFVVIFLTILFAYRGSLARLLRRWRRRVASSEV